MARLPVQIVFSMIKGEAVKLVSIAVNGQRRVGILGDHDQCHVLCPDVHGIPTAIESLIGSDEHRAKLNQLVRAGLENVESAALSGVTIHAPVRRIEKVICIGTNYADHCREMGGEPPRIPVVFNVFPSAIIGPGQEIRLPAISRKVDFEAELVVVIGKSGKNIPTKSAMNHVFGYCCGNDITARDWQKEKPGGQWLLGKTFDTFAPLGPFIRTKDEIPNPHDLKIQLRLNGTVMQDSCTDQLIFPVDFLISHLSKFVTLAPGDLIFTGTPSGVGAGRKPPLFLKPSDRIEVEIQGLGVLFNTVVADS